MGMDVDTLLLIAKECHPRLKWAVNGKWCRYCGCRAAYLWYSSPWGLYKLCKQHHREWKHAKIDIDDEEEPKNREHAINPSDIQEKRYLIEIIENKRRQ